MEFTGEISTQASADEVAARLAEVLRLTPERAQAFMQGGARMVRRGLDPEMAGKYLAVLNRTGAVFRLHEELPQAGATPVAAAGPVAPAPAAAVPAPPAPGAPSARVGAVPSPARRSSESEPRREASGPWFTPYLRDLAWPVLLIGVLLVWLVASIR